jgi:hypothetical protein
MAMPDLMGGARGGGDIEARHTEGEEENATPDLLLKYSDATLATYILRLMKHLKHESKTLIKTPKKT